MKRLRPWFVSRRSVPFCSLVAAVIAVAAAAMHARQPQRPIGRESHQAAQPQADIDALSRPDRPASRWASTLDAPGSATFGDESVCDLVPPFEPPLAQMQLFDGYRPLRFDVPSQIGVDASDADIDKDVRSGMAYRF